MSFNMGFMGIRKDSAKKGAGSVVLKTLLKFSLLKYYDNETWELAETVVYIVRCDILKVTKIPPRGDLLANYRIVL